ncbi:IS30 family transposase [Candidatus Roizmanbacteria bacterium]|nr:IS30 family transposase [Candidatus Roizmanbacteria bacterium]
MHTYTRLKMEEREEISRMLASRKTLRMIAKVLRRSVSTISREVRAGSCNKYTYRAKRAQDRSYRDMSKRNTGNYLLTKNEQLREYVFGNLRQKWSPIQIAELIKKQYSTDNSMRISHETIYSYLYVLPRGTLKKDLSSRPFWKRGIESERLTSVQKKLKR